MWFGVRVARFEFLFLLHVGLGGSLSLGLFWVCVIGLFGYLNLWECGFDLCALLCLHEVLLCVLGLSGCCNVFARAWFWLMFAPWVCDACVSF